MISCAVNQTGASKRRERLDLCPYGSESREGLGSRLSSCLEKSHSLGGQRQVVNP